MNIPNIKHLSHRIIRRARHHIEKVSKTLYEKGDPDFVDERIKPELEKEEESLEQEEKSDPNIVDERKKPDSRKKESFFDSLFNFWTK